MSAFTIFLLAGWGAICNVWFWLIVAQRRARRDGLFLDGAANRPTGTSVDSSVPSVCVVVAARNESEGLASCLRSLLAQDHPELSVRVIDDRSEDDTFDIAQRFARSDPRVSTVRIDALPPRWMGKSHALWQGTSDIDTDWLLFTDVDCKLKHHAVVRAIDEALVRNVRFLSLWPQQSAGGFWEHATIPLCGGIIALWFGSQRVNDPDSRLAFANGQFILVERTAYEQIRGHEAVRSAIIEDIPLAEHAKKSNVACWVASGRNLVSVRMYDNYASIVNGWARIYVGALRSGTKIVLSILWLLLGSLLPYAASFGLAISFYLNWKSGAETPLELICFATLCASHLILMMIASYRFWGMGRCRRIDLIWYPLSVCVVVRILAKSWWWLTIKRRIPWRDTGYKIDGMGRIVE